MTSFAATATKAFSRVTVGGRVVGCCGVCGSSVCCGALLRHWLRLGVGCVTGTSTRWLVVVSTCCCGSSGTTLRVGAGAAACGGVKMSRRVSSCCSIVVGSSGMVATVSGLLSSVLRVVSVS